jgi:catechol 2,3-dioxygenase-like lactoylglutathione lyase family enzyme
VRNGGRRDALMNPRVRALGETVLRVKDLVRVKRFYTDVIGLDVLREFEGIVFLKLSDGYAGHTQIIGRCSGPWAAPG